MTSPETPQYRIVVTGPGDEYLGTVPLDGTDLDLQSAWARVGDDVATVMGSVHRAACTALPDPDDDK